MMYVYTMLYINDIHVLLLTHILSIIMFSSASSHSKNLICYNKFHVYILVLVHVHGNVGVIWGSRWGFGDSI